MDGSLTLRKNFCPEDTVTENIMNNYYFLLKAFPTARSEIYLWGITSIKLERIKPSTEYVQHFHWHRQTERERERGYERKFDLSVVLQLRQSLTSFKYYCSYTSSKIYAQLYFWQILLKLIVMSTANSWSDSQSYIVIKHARINDDGDIQLSIKKTPIGVPNLFRCWSYAQIM